MTAIRPANISHDAAVERLQPYPVDAARKDALVILKAQKRLLRLKSRFGSWARIERETHVNHGHMSALILHGTVPHSKEIRRALGLPAVMPSERNPRAKKIIPLLGSDCWKCLAFKKIRPRKNRNGAK